SRRSASPEPARPSLPWRRSTRCGSRPPADKLLWVCRIILAGSNRLPRAGLSRPRSCDCPSSTMRAVQARHTISVAVVVGAQRERAARLMKALSQQTLTERLEVIVIDTRPHAPALEPVSGPVMKILRLEACSSYGEARARAVREATGEIVAFLEDHCYPQPGWAEALAAAYGADSAAIGYSFANANPGSLVSRIVHLATYGEWEAPERDAVRSLPGGNVSYRREHLLELGDGLPAML